jgi:hypothetical protein
MAFGSCRTSVPHDEAGNHKHGVDALRAYALEMAQDRSRWPDLVLFLGDQVYADETSDQMQDFIRSRRDIRQPPGHELRDYEEYAHLYWLAWSDDANRWLLSTLPSAMIFDDHDIRDDWNTSLAWRLAMATQTWWHQRIVAGLGSYWVYQHLGNLSPEARAADPLWQRVVRHDGDDEPDLSDALDELAGNADRDPTSYHWSYARDFDDVRLVVVDTRAARVLTPTRRCMLDEAEMEWLDGQMRGGFRHLLVGTSLPFLLSPGLHNFEAWNEALAGGAWGERGARFGERLRQAVDLEHWGAFQEGFRQVAQMTLDVAEGHRGPAPDTVTFLSGDVHHSYVSEVRGPRWSGLFRRSSLARRSSLSRPSGWVGLLRRWAGQLRRWWSARGSSSGPGSSSPSTSAPGPSSALRPLSAPTPDRSRIVQAVCSPIRNPLPYYMRFATAFLSYGLAGPLGVLAVRSAKVPDPPIRWRNISGPWFDNNLATLEDRPEGLALTWSTGTVHEEAHEHPRLEQVAAVLLSPPRPEPPPERTLQADDRHWDSGDRHWDSGDRPTGTRELPAVDPDREASRTRGRVG